MVEEKIELVALDYHGTLSFRKKSNIWSVSSDVVETLLKARKYGIKLAIVTSGSGKTVPGNIRSLSDILAFENGTVFIYNGKCLMYKPKEWNKIRELFLGLQDYVDIIRNVNRLVIAPKNSGKDLALKRIKEMLNIKGKVLALGDGENDVALLREADIGVAPANAVEEVKKVADYVCDKANGECVKEVIENIISHNGIFYFLNVK
ncbi:MAG: hypothetical protein B6U76_08755 [Desulfurococcales archaeon ex4484_217_2]|nr:MAG: hypothetical protein B6U76_08755 [Desulfurococcales archaeon ex4484_217_2]